MNDTMRDTILLTIGSGSWVSSDMLEKIDQALGIALKIVAITSFVLVIILNYKKIKNIFKK